MNETTPKQENIVKGKKTRRRFDAEFKKAAIEHCLRHEGDLSLTANQLGINYWTLRDWLEKARGAAAVASGPRSSAELENENRKLKAELTRITEQRDILKKSLGILSTP
jgi:transposase